MLVFDDNPIQLLFLKASEQCAAGLMNDALASWRRQMMSEQGIVVRRRRTPGEVGYGLIYCVTQPLPYISENGFPLLLNSGQQPAIQC